MSKQTSRGARLTALALATGTLVVTATSSAGAAPVSVPDVFGGKATATAIHVEVNLPVALPVPGVGTITSFWQDISFTEGNTSKGVAPRPVSVAKAVLGDGNIVLVSDLLALNANASLDGQRNVHDELLQDVNLGLVKASVGKLSSSVSPESASTTLTSSSTASLAELSIGLSGLTDTLGLGDKLEEVAGTLEQTVDENDGAITNAIDDALGVLNGIDTTGMSQTVVDQVEAVTETLEDLLAELTDTLTQLTGSTDLVRLSLLKSTQKVTRVGDTVTATATSEVGGLDILGGLVTVDAAKTTSTSSANGTRGSAAASSSTDVAHVRVADVLELAVGTNGLTGKLLGQDLPDVAKDAFQTVLETINTALGIAGVQIVNGDETSSVDPNGQYASSDSQGLMVIVNPLRAANPLVKVQLVPAGTAVNAARFNRRNPPRVAPPTGNTPQGQGKTPLAHTGAELPLFALVGTGLAGVALVVRRRRFGDV